MKGIIFVQSGKVLTTAILEFDHIIAAQIVINLIKKLTQLQVYHYKLSLLKLKTHDSAELLLSKKL